MTSPNRSTTAAAPARKAHMTSDTAALTRYRMVHAGALGPAFRCAAPRGRTTTTAPTSPSLTHASV
ncbi:hypothetical protein GCM10010160_11750 [Acrocarpospora corrugata]